MRFYFFEDNFELNNIFRMRWNKFVLENIITRKTNSFPKTF